MSFSWLLHLLQFPGSAHPFYEHCPYYSKKSMARQEKILSGKLAPAQSKDKKRKELYLVEGDSAGFSTEKVYLDFFKKVLLYLVYNICF